MGDLQADRDMALRRAKWWCILYRECDRQRSHLARDTIYTPDDEVPDDAFLDACVADLERPKKADVRTDLELDIDAAVEPVRGRGRGGGRGKGRGGRVAASLAAASSAASSSGAAPAGAGGSSVYHLVVGAGVGVGTVTASSC